MAHYDQNEFIQSCLRRFASIVNGSTNILEIGSQDINGSIRDYFPAADTKRWLGLDLGNGKGVDFVIPGELIQLPNGWAHISFSTECFEHASNWSEIFLNMTRITCEHGLVIVTFAGEGRAAHGTVDSIQSDSPFTNSYYKNISLVDFASTFDLHKYFTRYSLEANALAGDTYFWGIRSGYTAGSQWMTPEESLARARGQLGVVMNANRDLEMRIRELETKLKFS